MTTPTSRRRSSGKGFTRAGGLVRQQIHSVSAQRGFAQSEILTQWAEIVGPDIAGIARPVDVSYARSGFGATLTVLTLGAHAPILEMQKAQLRDRVNAAYGYNAISRIRITQTAASGFADGQVAFAPAPKAQSGASQPSQEVKEKSAQSVEPIRNDTLREALALLGTNILSKSHR